MPDDLDADRSVTTSTEPSPEPPAVSPPPKRDKGVVGKIIGGIVGALVLLIVLFLALFNWDWLRGPIGRYASAQAHREVRIDGHLRVHLLTWTPRITVEKLFIGQPDWAKGARKQPFGTIESAVVDIKLLPLFTGRMDLPLVDIEKPNFVLYADAKGRSNWDFSDPNSPKAGKPFKLPPIQKFVIAGGHIDVEDVQKKLRLTATVNSTERLAGGAAETFRLLGNGTINRQPFKMDVRGGPLINVRRDRPYPYDLDVSAGFTHVVAHGQITRPFDFGHIVARATVTGHDLNDLYGVTGVALPNSPPYAISGDVKRDGKVVDITRLSGRVGASDIGGHLNVDMTNKRPFLKAQLTSRLLDFADLASLFGAPGASKAATAEQKVEAKAVTAGGSRLLPDATLQTDRMRSLDADVTYKAAAVKAAPNLPLRAVSLGAKLNDGLLKLDPIALGFPQGQLNGNATLNARGKDPVTDVDLRLSNIELANFIPSAKGGVKPLDGTLAARAKLHGVGNSVHRAASTADGQVTALIPHGQIRQAFAELLGIDATAGLFRLLNKDQHQTDLRCAVADFRVKDGVMQADRITIDTTVVVVNGQGRINLGDESLALNFVGKPTKFRLIRLDTPLTVGGHLTSPTFGIKPGGAIVQVAAGLGLAVVASPLAAILPFLAAGGTHNADCGALAEQAESGAAPIAASQTHAPAHPARHHRRR